MARNENPPFSRGSTWYDGDTIDSNNLGGVELEGMEWVFEDTNPNTGVWRSGRPVRCRVVRNSSGVALLPKLLATFSVTAGQYGKRVAGFSHLTPATGSGSVSRPGNEGYPIDEYLPTAGAPANDLLWIVIEGPATVITSMSDAPLDLAVGGWVVAQTAAASTHSTTAGRVLAQALTGATAVLGEAVQNRIGRALTARSTNTTNTDTLVDVGHW